MQRAKSFKYFWYVQKYVLCGGILSDSDAGDSISLKLDRMIDTRKTELVYFLDHQIDPIKVELGVTQTREFLEN